MRAAMQAWSPPAPAGASPPNPALTSCTQSRIAPSQPSPALRHLLGGVVDGFLDLVQAGAEHHRRYAQLQVHTKDGALQEQRAAHGGGRQAPPQRGEARLDGLQQRLRVTGSRVTVKGAWVGVASGGHAPLGSHAQSPPAARSCSLLLQAATPAQLPPRLCPHWTPTLYIWAAQYSRNMLAASGGARTAPAFSRGQAPTRSSSSSHARCTSPLRTASASAWRRMWRACRRGGGGRAGEQRGA